MALAISLIVTILEILNGFLNTDSEKIKMAKTFKANKLQILTKIVIPANISTFINIRGILSIKSRTSAI